MKVYEYLEKNEEENKTKLEYYSDLIYYEVVEHEVAPHMNVGVSNSQPMNDNQIRDDE